MANYARGLIPLDVEDRRFEAIKAWGKSEPLAFRASLRGIFSAAEFNPARRAHTARCLLFYRSQQRLQRAESKYPASIGA